MTATLPPGSLFAGDYRIVAPLSAGGMGALYVVEQLSTRKLRALKLMHGQLLGDESSRRRFEQEARICARIPSEHVVEVQAAGVDPQSGLPYLVMELLEGENLDAMVRRRGPLMPAEVRVTMEQICHAVGAAHQAGIVHRDLKPLNVFMARARRTDAAFMVKVLDFGIAKLLSEQATQTAGIGSPLWLAPEQAGRGQVVPATDVWALALLAYFLLTGACFWASGLAADATITQVMREVLFDPIPAASARAAERGCALPPGFDAWFAGCLNRDPAARFPDAHQAFARLAPLLPPGGRLGPELGVPLSAAAELRAAHESGQLGMQSASGAIWSSGSASGVVWGSGSPSASGVVGSRPMSPSNSIVGPTQGAAALASAGKGVAFGCLLAAVLVLVLGLTLGAGAYFLWRRATPGPSATASAMAEVGVSASQAAQVPASPSQVSAAPTAAERRSLDLEPTSTRGAASAASPGKEISAPGPVTNKQNATDGGSSAPGPTANPAGQKPTEALAWDIGRSLGATGFGPCLPSTITLPSHGWFHATHSMTVRFEGPKLLGLSIQGRSNYKPADLINSETRKPPTQAEVDAELGRVLACIRRKASTASLPDNRSKGTVVVNFSDDHLYAVSVP